MPDQNVEEAKPPPENINTAESDAGTDTSEDGQPGSDQQAPPEGEPADPVKGAAKQAETAVETKPTTKPSTRVESATVSTAAKSGTSIDRKEVPTMTDLNEVQKRLEEAKKALKEQAAKAADLEREVQKLQEVDHLKANADFALRTEVYGKVSDEVKRCNDEALKGLDELAQRIKNVPNLEAMLKQIEDKRAKVDADIKAKSDQMEKLKQEVEQLGKEVATAAAEANKRQKELEDKKEALTTAKDTSKGLLADVNTRMTSFKKEDQGNVLATWSFVLETRSDIEKKLKPLLAKPEDLQKDLEGKQKALDDANEKIRQLAIKRIEKQAEINAALDALEATPEDRTMAQEQAKVRLEELNEDPMKMQSQLEAASKILQDAAYGKGRRMKAVDEFIQNVPAKKAA